MPELFDLMGYADSGAAPVNAVGDTYQSIATLAGTIVAGTYEVTRFVKYDFSVTNRDLYFRTSTDGGSTWDEIVVDPKQTTVDIAFGATTSAVLPAGPIDFRFEARKQDGSGTFDITKVQLYMKRIGDG